MNIFVTHNNPEVAAKMLCDRHVPKMLLESAQMLSNAVHAYGNATQAPYKPMYLKHPCSLWTIESKSNFLWLFKHARAIEKEFFKRYKKPHKCSVALDVIESQIPTLKFNRMKRTPFAICMPRIYRTGNTINSYRSYIKAGKLFATWRKGTKRPKWMSTHVVEYDIFETANYIRTSVPLPSNIPQLIADLSASIASVI